MTCKHKFQVVHIIPSCPSIQILTCKRCNNRFYGYGGKKGKPEYIRPVIHVDNPLWFTTAHQKSTLNDLQTRLEGGQKE